jgi:aquaporin NIP
MDPLNHNLYLHSTDIPSYCLLFVKQVPIYIIAQIIGSLMATYIGSLIYGIKSDIMMTQPLQGSNSAFWVELIATFIIMFLVTALTSEPQSVSTN